MRIVVALIVCLLSAAAPALGDSLDSLKTSYRRPASIPFPADNPYTLTKATLGKMLFFDPRLSSGANVTCVSCHNPSLGWEAGQAKATGTTGRPTGRHAPTVLNLAWTQPLFWDGRAPTLEAQARGPITHPDEMNMATPALLARLKAIPVYVALFDAAFPNQGLTETTLLQAIATYERTIVSGRAPFDRWIEGDPQAISADAQRGFALFNGKAGCSACHGGWNFTDNQFHDVGLATEDVGRAAVTGKPQDQHAFKTPGLRNIAQRAPYMHDGGLENLEQVISHYQSGGIERPSRSAQMKALDLTETETNELIAFLETLTGADAPVALPLLPN